MRCRFVAVFVGSCGGCFGMGVFWHGSVLGKKRILTEMALFFREK